MATETQIKPAPKTKTRLFKLEDIPDVMRSQKGWPIAAALMSRWFKYPAHQMSDAVKQGNVGPSTLNPAQLDETTVKMSWVMSFKRVQLVLEALKLKENWATTKGLALLKTRVDRQSLGRKGQCWVFGDLSQPAKVVDETCQVNMREVGSLKDPMDDFYGAMGKALLKVAVSGTVATDAQGKHTIEVTELGFYLRDTYDFNDGDDWFSQNLGDWGFTGVQPSFLPRADIELGDVEVEDDPASVRERMYAVENDDFRRWRGLNGRGGDFVVLSDVLRTRLATPLKFAL